jgi:SP family sugar porter-like MFS transporter
MSDQNHMSPRYNMTFLWLICLVAAMGGLLFGYDWVVIGGAKAFYEPLFGISASPLYQGMAMSSALFGCLVGAACSGFSSDRLGRKRLLIFSGFLFTVSAVWTALCGSFAEFMLARFVGGVGIGLASNLSPMYIAEISPAHFRGRFVSINQLTIVIGILAAQVTNLLIAAPVPKVDQIRLLLNPESAKAALADDAEFDRRLAAVAAAEIVDPAALEAVREAFPNVAYLKTATAEEKAAKLAIDAEIMDVYLRATWNGRAGWRWMFGAETIPALLFFLLMFFVPESPRWLVKYGRNETARQILAKVGGDEYAAAEVEDIQSTIAQEEVAQVHFRDLLEPRVMSIVRMGVILAVFQQWCGINVIFNYAQEVFKASGYEVGDLMFSIVITGIVNLVFTFVAIFTVDRIGRKPLMLIGAAGLFGIYAILGTGFLLKSQGIHMLILVVSAIACYAMSLAPVTWVVISEIFPNRIRGAAMSIAVFALWVGCSALTFTFPFLNAGLGAHGTFWLYAAICGLGFLYIFRRLPETKNKSLEDIERELVD